MSSLTSGFQKRFISVSRAFGDVQAVATRRPFSSTTRSPSSLKNSPRCGGSRSMTVSEGRHRRTPLGRHDQRPVPTESDAWRSPSSSASSLEPRIVEAEFVIGRPLLAQDLAHAQAGAGEQLLEQRRGRRALLVVDDMRLDAGVADQPQNVARGRAFRVVVDDDVHRRLPRARARLSLQSKACYPAGP